jgi:flavin reductase (DIM6/NTAB) family NADH-FMN oxidoreductase RutF
MHTTCEPAILYFGTPVVLVSSKNEDETDNLAPISSIFWLGWRCVIGLGSTNKTTENLIRTKQCVINMPSVNEVAAVDRLALKTASNPVPPTKAKRGYLFEADKFGSSGFTREESHVVAPPRVRECPVQMEAEVVAINLLGQDDPAIAGRITTFELKIVRVHLEESILMDGYDDRVDPDKWRPLMMSFQKFYGLGDQVHESTLSQIPEKMYRMVVR